MNHVVISGATGRIGSRAVGALVEAGFEVTALGRDAGRLTALPGAAHIWPLERTKTSSAEKIQSVGGGLLIHLAGMAERTGSHSALADSALAHAREIADLAVRARMRGVVLVSSIYSSLEERGRSSEYGKHKRAVEYVFQSRPEFPTLTLRLPPVYGEGLGGNIPLLANLVRLGIPIPFGLARAPRDYLAIGNLTDLLIRVALADDAAWKFLNGCVYEPSDGLPLSTNDLVRMISAVIGRRSLLLPFPAAALIPVAGLFGKHELAAAAFSPLLTASNNAVDILTGWKPKIQPPHSLAFLASLE